jgi:UDP-N-acetylmuramoylalanine-D-glutamate ligase
MTRVHKVHHELIDLIAGGCRSADVAEFTPSTKAKKRVAYLLGRLKDDRLSEEETSELDQYVELEHIMRLAKAKARQQLGQ